MKWFNQLGEWLAANILGDLLRSFFADKLELLGMGVVLATILAPIAAIITARAAWALFAPPPEIEWAELDPNDGRVMQAAFDDLHVVASLARKLNENAAETIDEFTSQVRRLGLHGKHTVWQRIDLNNEELIREMYAKRNIIEAVARKLNGKASKSLEEFRDQLRTIQSE